MISPTLRPICEFLCEHQVIYKVVVLNFLAPENNSKARWHPQIQYRDITLPHHHGDLICKSLLILLSRRIRNALSLLPNCYQQRYSALFDDMHNKNSQTVRMKGASLRCTGNVRYPQRVTVGEKMARVRKPLSH